MLYYIGQELFSVDLNVEVIYWSMANREWLSQKNYEAALFLPWYVFFNTTNFLTGPINLYEILNNWHFTCFRFDGRTARLFCGQICLIFN